MNWPGVSCCLRASLKNVASANLADVSRGFQPGGTDRATKKGPVRHERHRSTGVFSGRQDAALHGRSGGPPLCFVVALLMLGDVWAYWPPLEGPGDGFEDISHATINVDFMVLCFEHGIVFTREDLARLENTLLKRVLLADDRVCDTMGGGGKFN